MNSTTQVYTDKQLVLQTFLKNNLVAARDIEFATSLAFWQVWRKPLSYKQSDCLDKMIQRICAPTNAPAAGNVESLDMTKVRDVFAHARSHKLKYPKIRLGETAKRIVVAEDSHGTIWVNSNANGGYWLVRIEKDNTIIWNGNRYSPVNTDPTVRKEVKDLLIELAADPKATATKYGKLTNSCCYCGLPLSTPESLTAGYGDTCAKHWGLPWGNIKISQDTVLTPVAA